MPPARYSLPSTFLHWMTVLLIAAAYATIELRVALWNAITLASAYLTEAVKARLYKAEPELGPLADRALHCGSAQSTVAACRRRTGSALFGA